MDKEVAENLGRLPMEKILAMARDALDLRLEAEKEFYRLMSYVERTNRHREMKQYRKSSFGLFIRNEFGFDYGRYQQNRIVLERYPEDVAAHGMGFVQKVYSKHGDKYTAKVLKEINSRQKKRKSPLPVEDKEMISQSFKPDPPRVNVAVPASGDEQPENRTLQPEPPMDKECYERKMRELTEHSRAMTEQREKLKATVLRQKKELTEKDQRIAILLVDIRALQKENAALHKAKDNLEGELQQARDLLDTYKTTADRLHDIRARVENMNLAHA